MVQIKAFSYNPNAKYQPSGVYKTKDPDIIKQTIEVKQPSDASGSSFKVKFPDVQYSHREIPISPARLGDTFCCLGDFLSFHRDNRYSQRDAQVTQRDVVTVHRA